MNIIMVLSVNTYIYLCLIFSISSALLINENQFIDGINLYSSIGRSDDTTDTKLSTKEAIEKSREEIERWRIQLELPGVVAGVSINGTDIWTEAFGYSDIENNVKVKTMSIFRMASISKSLTTTLVAKLIDEGKLDLNESIHKYLSHDIFPIKTWNGKNVTITLGQVMSHTAGLRVTSYPDDFYSHVYERTNVTQTVGQFKNVDLIFEPGKHFAYSNYGWQIIGAIIESVVGDTYENAMRKMLTELGMKNTYGEEHDVIILNRSRYYYRNGKALSNTMIADDLFPLEKWLPSGGMMSTVPDLLKFGNVWLSSFNDVKGFIKSSTVRQLWTPVEFPFGNEQLHYAKGWIIANLTQNLPIKSFVWHSGGLAGVSTILELFPEHNMVVALLTNLGSVPTVNLAAQIALNFV